MSRLKEDEDPNGRSFDLVLVLALAWAVYFLVRSISWLNDNFFTLCYSICSFGHFSARYIQLDFHLVRCLMIHHKHLLPFVSRDCIKAYLVELCNLPLLITLSQTRPSIQTYTKHKPGSGRSSNLWKRLRFKTKNLMSFSKYFFVNIYQMEAILTFWWETPSEKKMSSYILPSDNREKSGHFRLIKHNLPLRNVPLNCLQYAEKSRYQVTVTKTLKDYNNALHT